jgi:hypothetical protein
MLTTLDVIEHWARHGRGSLATKVRSVATSALGTYGAYLGYGLLHGDLRKPFDGAEANAPLAGDDLVARPDSMKTFVRDIWAPPDAVWPYLVQMGFGRGGWYGWYPMENGGRGSLPGVIGLWQELAVGDVIPDGPRASEGLGVWRVVELEPSRAMVLFSRRVLTTGREIEPGVRAGEPTVECSWAFVLRRIAGGCRLIVRVRAKFVGADAFGLTGRVLRRVFDVGDTVMEWTMLDGIKHRAERDRDRAASREPPRD